MSATTTTQTLEPIPQIPKSYMGLLGNLPDVDPSFFMRSIIDLADTHGEIYELDLLNRKAVVISSYRLSKEVQDDERFDKKIIGPLVELKPLLGDGLFTANSTAPNWGKAHRILMPVFGPLSVRKMFGQMMDIASQMILRWDRMGPRNNILCSDDFTRLAFDTIGICSFNFRFNDFYSEHMHEFADQMTASLIEAGKRANRTALENKLRYYSEKEYTANVNAMLALCDEIVKERVENPQPEVNDLLNTMLSASDPVTGEKLDHENIRQQMVTFLVAGHETTSGTLSFAFYNMLTNPETYHAAQQEVDEILGDGPLTADLLPKFKYLDAVIKETLRFRGPIGLSQRHAKKDTVLGGKYKVSAEDVIITNYNGLHHDPAAWGEDHAQFKPERMLDFSKVPDGAWRPFGIGMRSCIGRTFAEQEMIMNLALILQRFQVTMADPSYTLKLKSALTVKPEDFNINVRRRPGKDLMVGLQSLPISKTAHKEEKGATSSDSDKPILTILYGSNAGTCKAYAEDLAEKAEAYGYKGDVRPMDSAVEHIEDRNPIAIITPSYEGKPADNAKKFVSWLETSSETEKTLNQYRYAVFGVGNSEWAHTFHKVPKLVDDLLYKMGAVRIVDTGLVDVKADTMGPWDKWTESFWNALIGSEKASAVGTGSTLKINIQKSVHAAGESEAKPSLGLVKQNVQLADTKVGPAKKHMEVELPEGMTYQSGDYLVIYPYNHRETIIRVIGRFKIQDSDSISISETRKAYLLTKEPTPVRMFLASRVELNTLITQRQLERLAELSDGSKESLTKLAGDKAYQEMISSQRFSIIDVLEDHPDVKLEFSEYLDMLKPLSPRQYSISSSPLASATSGDKYIASISYDVQEGPALSGKDRTFHGVASTFLADRKPGSLISCVVRPTNASFHLPTSTETPVIMVAAGSGLAPMRGFLQERAAIQKANTKKLGPALLYFGCRDVESDYIYHTELEEWEKQGVVSLRPCFSKNGPADGFKYTHERMWADREEIAKLFKDGAKIFVCGSASRIAKSTAEVCKKIYLENDSSRTEKDADDWLEKSKEDRYVTDVFG